MLPYQQGGLDALCGIYSIVNVERLINKTSENNSLKLFKSMVSYLENQKRLSEILTEGMILKDLKDLLNTIVGDRIFYKKTHFAGVSNPSLNTFWNDMLDFLKKNDNGAIILSLSGVHDHWTVIENITDNQILLHDSDGLKKLNRKNCTTSDEKGQRHHVFYPAQTIFLMD